MAYFSEPKKLNSGGFSIEVIASKYGRHFSKTARGSTLTEARKNAKRIEYELENKKINQDKNISLSDFILNHYLPYKQQTVSSGWFKNIKNCHCKTILAHFGDIKLKLITPMLIVSFRSKRAELVSKRYTDLDITVLRDMFSRAEEWDIVETSPFRKSKIKLFNEKKSRTRVLNKEEIRLLLDHASHDTQNLIMFCIYTGMRPKEICNAKWSDIDYKNNLIVVYATKTNTVRRIPLSNELKIVLASIPQASDYIIQHNGQKIETYRKTLQTTAKRAGLENISPYVLRHTFASLHAEAGTPLATLAEFMGHSDIKTTAKYYIHLSQEHLQKNINNFSVSFLLGNSLGGSQNGFKVVPRQGIEPRLTDPESKPAKNKKPCNNQKNKQTRKKPSINPKSLDEFQTPSKPLNEGGR